MLYGVKYVQKCVFCYTLYNSKLPCVVLTGRVSAAARTFSSTPVALPFYTGETVTAVFELPRVGIENHIH